MCVNGKLIHHCDSQRGGDSSLYCSTKRYSFPEFMWPYCTLILRRRGLILRKYVRIYYFEVKNATIPDIEKFRIKSTLCFVSISVKLWVNQLQWENYFLLVYFKSITGSYQAASSSLNVWSLYWSVNKKQILECPQEAVCRNSRNHKVKPQGR